MARTQWSRVHWCDQRELGKFETQRASSERPEPGSQTQPIHHLPQRLSIMAVEEPELTLSMPLALGEGDSEDDISLQDAKRLELASGITGLDVAVRGWESMGASQRERFARRAGEALSRALHTASAQPYFDFRARVWSLELRLGNSERLHAVFTGEFPQRLSHAGGSRRVPADASALIRFWSQRNGSSTFEPGVYALYSPWTLEPERVHGIGAWGSTNVHVIFAEVIDVLEKRSAIEHVYLEFSDRHFAQLSNGERLKRASQVATVFRTFLPPGVELGPLQEVPRSQPPQRLRTTLVVAGGRAVCLEIIPLAEFPEREVPESIQVLIGLRVRERWLPGEHGYRFFPAFYRHLYDTMRRTPILETVEKSAFSQEQERAVSVSKPEAARYVESPRTVYDNLQPTSRHVLAFAQNQRPAVLSRARPKSLEEIREYLRLLYGSASEGGFGTNPRESMRFTLKLLKYLTTGPSRRKDLETKSWWDFVEGDTYSESVRTLIERWPEALVAMDAKRADARTHGNAFVQLVLDNVSASGYRDGTLRGPTSEAWLSHWRRYLEAQGVEFIHGELVKFTHMVDREGQTHPWPVVRCYEPRYSNSVDDVPLMPGYFVLAASAPRAQALAKSFRDVCRKMPDFAPDDESDMQSTANLKLGNPTHANPDGDLRHFAGIQFYFAEDIFWVDGHVYYPDSPWGLTSISQARFWEDRTDWEHGYRGILSAIIGKWDAPGQFTTDKQAWKCSPLELATEVWTQIKNSVASRARGARRTRPGTLVADRQLDQLPDPLYFHLDDSLQWDEKEQRYNNAQPFHIASHTGWSTRPGDPREGYRVEHGWVVCGMFTKTFTRAPCMEAANESGRHAVNAILAHQDGTEPGCRPLRGTRCQVFDPEEYEVDDVRWFKDLDEKLAARGLPHFMDILDVDRYADTVLTGGPDDPLDPLNVLRQLSRFGASFKDILYPAVRRRG